MPDRSPRTHIVIIDGTLSRLHDGAETHAGMLYKLLTERGATASQQVTYDEGVQGEGVRKWLDLAAGITINQSIETGYGALASRYEPGDRIMLFGYSRGAYAVRSVAGFIGRVGLLKKRHATQRRIHRAFRYYAAAEMTQAARLFSERFCHRDVPIAFIGVWDTVKALGLPYPLITRLAPMATEFHDHHLGDNVACAVQALALDETRTAYDALPWALQPGWRGHLEQAWFPGAHMDVGGQLEHFPAARPLAALPFVWVLERAEARGLALPAGWRERFTCNPAAPAHGTWRGRARYFLLRRARLAGHCGSEVIHPSATARQVERPRYRPKARWVGPQQRDHAEPSDVATT